MPDEPDLENQLDAMKQTAIDVYTEKARRLKKQRESMRRLREERRQEKNAK